MKTEHDIDIAIANLVFLKDGKNDKLAKLLNPAIEALKEFRTSRFKWKKVAKQLKATESHVLER